MWSCSKCSIVMVLIFGIFVVCVCYVVDVAYVCYCIDGDDCVGCVVVVCI